MAKVRVVRGNAPGGMRQGEGNENRAPGPTNSPEAKINSPEADTKAIRETRDAGENNERSAATPRGLQLRLGVYSYA